MECLYAPELVAGLRRIRIIGEEARHVRALRLRPGERVMLTNGAGLCAVAALELAEKEAVTVVVLEELPGFGESHRRFGLALGILEHRERMEFAVEKAVELGATDIFPLQCERSARKTISVERLVAKMLAAVKQCRRAILPALHPPQSVRQFTDGIAPVFGVIFLADPNGTAPTHVSGAVAVAVGPEGGFSDGELALFGECANLQQLKLAPRRLRAETAAIAACAVIAGV